MKKLVISLVITLAFCFSQTHNTIHRIRQFPSDTLGWYWRMWHVNSSDLIIAAHTVDKYTAGTTESWGAGPPSYTLWAFNVANWPAPTWQAGDRLITQADRDSSYGTKTHKGFYAIINDTLAGNVNPQYLLDDTLRAIPWPMPVIYDSIHNDTAFCSLDTVRLVWNLPKQTIGIPLLNNIIGYALYREINGYGEDDTLPAGGGYQYFVLRKIVTDTTCLDTVSGLENSYMFYAIKLVYRPDTTPKIMSLFLSRNSVGILKTPIVGIEEHGSAGKTMPMSVNPNPSKGQVVIRITDAEGYLRIYDSSGKRVRTLPKVREVIWNGADNAGIALPSGVYFIELKSAHGKYTQKVILER